MPSFSRLIVRSNSHFPPLMRFPACSADDSPELTELLDIDLVPSLFLFKSGEVVHRGHAYSIDLLRKLMNEFTPVDELRDGDRPT